MERNNCMLTWRKIHLVFIGTFISASIIWSLKYLHCYLYVTKLAISSTIMIPSSFGCCVLRPLFGCLLQSQSVKLYRKCNIIKILRYNRWLCHEGFLLWNTTKVHVKNTLVFFFYFLISEG